MTNQEFSNEFDILYNNIMSNAAPGLDEYEKSVFLTKAQDEILKNYFNPKGNKYTEGFDDSEKRQIDFSMLIKYKPIKDILAPTESQLGDVIISLPNDIFFILNETVYVTRKATYENGEIMQSNLELTVVPLKFNEYTRLMSKPYKKPLKWQAWRLLSSSGSGTNNYAELVIGTKDTLISYNIRYIKRPRAIILTNLENGTLDNGKTKEQSCELDPILHPEILQRAVELAKSAYIGDISSQIQMGQRAE